MLSLLLLPHAAMTNAKTVAINKLLLLHNFMIPSSYCCDLETLLFTSIKLHDGTFAAVENILISKIWGATIYR